MMYRPLIEIVLALLLVSFGAMMYFVIQRDWTLSFWAGGAFVACCLICQMMSGGSEKSPRYIDRWDVGHEDEL